MAGFQAGSRGTVDVRKLSRASSSRPSIKRAMPRFPQLSAKVTSGTGTSDQVLLAQARGTAGRAKNPRRPGAVLDSPGRNRQEPFRGWFTTADNKRRA